MNINHNILERCKKKDRKAQFELYKLCYGILMSICLRYHKNKEDAEEVLNQGFLKILTKLDKYKTNVPFEAWIRRIMINTIIDEFRKNKKNKEMIQYTDSNDLQTTYKHVDYNTADQNFDAEQLQNMLNKLPNITGQVFNLFAIDGYGHKEIAGFLGMSVGTSKWHVSTARNTLQKMILKEREKEQNKITAIERPQIVKN